MWQIGSGYCGNEINSNVHVKFCPFLNKCFGEVPSCLEDALSLCLCGRSENPALFLALYFKYAALFSLGTSALPAVGSEKSIVVGPNANGNIEDHGKDSSSVVSRSGREKHNLKDKEKQLWQQVSVLLEKPRQWGAKDNCISRDFFRGLPCRNSNFAEYFLRVIGAVHSYNTLFYTKNEYKVQLKVRWNLKSAVEEVVHNKRVSSSSSPETNGDGDVPDGGVPDEGNCDDGILVSRSGKTTNIKSSGGTSKSGGNSSVDGGGGGDGISTTLRAF